MTNRRSALSPTSSHVAGSGTSIALGLQVKEASHPAIRTAESIHPLTVGIHGHERKSALDLPEPILMTVLSLTPRH
jgi:hypothetical protein